MLGYLSLDIICSSKLTVFLELRSRKTVRFSEQIMSADKYPSIFSRQMKAIVYIFKPENFRLLLAIIDAKNWFSVFVYVEYRSFVLSVSTIWKTKPTKIRSTEGLQEMGSFRRNNSTERGQKEMKIWYQSEANTTNRFELNRTVACEASVSVLFRSKGHAKNCLSFHFSRGENRESRSSVFLCSETARKRLLRRLIARELNVSTTGVLPYSFCEEPQTSKPNHEIYMLHFLFDNNCNHMKPIFSHWPYAKVPGAVVWPWLFVLLNARRY